MIVAPGSGGRADTVWMEDLTTGLQDRSRQKPMRVPHRGVEVQRIAACARARLRLGADRFG